MRIPPAMATFRLSMSPPSSTPVFSHPAFLATSSSTFRRQSGEEHSRVLLASAETPDPSLLRTRKRRCAGDAKHQAASAARDES
eukprot:751897-Hanusia_phi.AAC.1